MSAPNKSRRRFLKATGVVGVGLIVGVPLIRRGPAAIPYAEDAEFSPNAFLQISSDNSIHFYLPSAEMGQGVTTGLTTLVAEELNIAPETIILHMAGAHSDYNNPEFDAQVTGGSTSTHGFYRPLRQAAATALESIRLAAATKLEVPAGDLELRDGHVHFAAQSTPYGDYAELASTLPLPTDVALKSAGDFQVIGRDEPRLDGLAKSTGQAEFGIDIEIPNLHRAVIVRCPVNGGSVKSVQAKMAEAMPGVSSVVTIDNGVAVVAGSYWQAKKAAEQLSIEWEMPPLADYSSDNLYAELTSAIAENDGKEAHVEGDFATAIEAAEKTLDAHYQVPYLAHATMEPMNCTAVVGEDSCEIWAPTQAPGMIQGAAEFHTGIHRNDIKVHNTFLGGGFGRRANVDFAIEAVQVAKASGLPVQVVWSREDDMRHDYYRPASVALLRAGFASDGTISAWSVKRAGPNIMSHTMVDALDTMAPKLMPNGVVNWASDLGHTIFNKWTVDHSSVEGFYEDYDIRNKEIRHVSVDPGLRTGFWRSVGHSFSGFAKESFFDEIAYASGQDALELRLRHSAEDQRLHRVIKRVAEEAGWADALPQGRFHGIAAHTSFRSSVAQVAEVSVTDGKIVVHRVTCVIDCGIAINPDIVKAQMESAIIFGITAALYGQIDLKNGAVQQGNFDNYPMLRMLESPEIDVHIMASDADPTGVGEPGLPPVAAAIGNAIFAATGERLRTLPFKLA